MPGQLTTFVLERKATLARGLADLLEFRPPQDDRTFSDAVMALIQTGIEPIEIARALKVSIPTVSRWAQGVSSPHELLVPSAIPALAEVAREQAATWTGKAAPAVGSKDS